MCAVNPPNFLNIIKPCLREKSPSQWKIKVHNPNKKGDGFYGELIFLSVASHDDDEAVLDLVLKNAHASPNLRNVQPIRKLYLNEIFFYEVVWPKYQNFLLMNEGLKGNFVKIAECYNSSIDDRGEFILLENLKSKGYNMVDLSKFWNIEQYKYVFRQYGKFHGLSYAFKKQRLEEFEEIMGNIEDCVGKMIEGLRGVGQMHLKKVYRMLDSDADGDLKEAFEKYGNRGWDIFVDSIRYEGDYGVLNHGDCWNNNIMVKQDSNGNIADLALIDFQLTRIASPVHDLSYCLYSGATQEVLDSFDELLQEYHASLSDVIRNFGEDPNEIYPYSVLRDEWKTYSKFGMLFGFMIWSVRCRNTEEILSIEELTQSGSTDELKERALSEEYIRNVGNIIRHVYAIGAL